MKNEIFKNFIIVGLIILAFLSIIFGSYLPLIKAQLFIDALGSVSQVKTVEEFEANFDKSFKYYSPVGDEEITKFLLNNIIQIVSQQNQSEAVDRKLTTYIEPYIFKNDVRHLLGGTQLYEILLTKYKHQEDIQKVESYIEVAYAIGPKLPPVLYNLLDIYRFTGQTQKAKQIGETILQYWPDDKNVENIVKGLPQ